MATQAVPGPKRQFTATSLGDATGTVGVDVRVGIAVFKGKGVLEGIGVDDGPGGVFVLRNIVAVGVAAAPDGRLQASMLRINKRLARKG